jgi:glycosyltransferase involved in cell wall biosynthesis
MYDHKELHPTSKMGKLWNFYYPKFWSQVLTVITVSNYTKQRLMEVCHIPETKIRVIYEAAEEHFRPVTQEAKEATKKKYDLSKEQYILSVAALNPRKNLGTLIKAWDVLRPQLGGQVNLVLVGMLYFNTSLAQLGLDNLPEDVILTGHVDDCDLPALYAGASAFVYPSLYEGFGLPPLEAMACGTPVVVSNVSSLPEVCGEAVVYIDPYSVDSLAEGILSVLTDRALSSHLSEKGLARVAEFSWERAAKEHLACFKEFM